jgi:hypothetical protein
LDVDIDEDLELIDEWIPESANYTTHDAYDECLGSLLYATQPDGDRLQGTVTKCLKSEDGTPIGKGHDNPTLDSREYEVELPDGSIDAFHANVISENDFAQVDSEGRRYKLVAGIIDHWKDPWARTPIDDGWITTPSNQKVCKKTTYDGWKLLV